MSTEGHYDLKSEENNEKNRQPAGQRINSAPTKLSNSKKKTNWGKLLGNKKANNKRKYGSTSSKRSASFNLSALDNNMSGLQVLSPKSRPGANSKTVDALETFGLDVPRSNNNSNRTTVTDSSIQANADTPKHKRSKSDNSGRLVSDLALKKFFLGGKVLSNRSASALGKLRGSYKCGKCGVPKKGHICPHELPKETKDATTQCSFDINPNIKTAQIRRLVTKLQEKGIITLSKASDAFTVLCEDVKIPVGTYQTTRAEVHQAATGATSSLSIASKTQRKSSEESGTKTKVKRRGTKKIKAKSTKAKLVKNKKPTTPKRANSLRTFDSIDSNNDDPFAMDMDPTDAFEYGELDLTIDPLTDDKWFGNDIIDETYDDEMSAMLSA